MDIIKLREPLSISDIEFRVQSINKGGYVTILPYKNARADQNRLDNVVGSLYWKREHVLNNHNCIVSIWNSEIKEWVSKEDTGTESFAEKEKGLASDSFKRACFNWGIGRELYDYPIISFKLKSNEYRVEGNKVKPTWDFKLREWSWVVEFKDGVVSEIEAKDESGVVRYSYPQKTQKQTPKAKQEKDIPIPKRLTKKQKEAMLVSTDVEALKKSLEVYALSDKEKEGIQGLIDKLEKK